MEHRVSEEMQYFNLLSSAIDEAYHDASVKMGLSDSAMWILYALCAREDACPLNDIIKLTGISKQTVHSAVKKLEDQGILTMENSGGRKKTVCLTAAGKKLAERTVCQLARIENEIFDSWTSEELEGYIRLTRRYLDSFREKVKEFPV